MYKDLPPEVIVEILLRLPVKELLRCRFVSKSFCSLIDTPEFVKQHLDLSKGTNTHLKLIRCTQETLRGDSRGSEENSGDTYFCAADLGTGLTTKAFNLVNPLRPTRFEFTGIKGSCNGLLLLHNNDRDIALWNPFTRRYKKLPFCPIGVPINYRKICCHFGLGYDSAADDYKVVRISSMESRLMVRHSIIWSVQICVFSLRSNSWRRIPYETNYACFVGSGSGLFANGALHWLDSTGRIAVFDLASAEFYRVVLPVHLKKCELGVLNEDLCLRSELEGGGCELYVGNHDDEGGLIWIQLFAVQEGRVAREVSTKRLKAMAYSKEGEKVLLDDGFDAIWYDIEKKIGHRIDIPGMPLGFDSHVCWESLVSLGGDSEFDGANI